MAIGAPKCADLPTPCLRYFDRLRHASLMLFALYALFFLSGAAGLIYESIWTRYLALLVGHSAYAQILVLTIFLGGMAVGSVLVGRYRQPPPRPPIWDAIVPATGGLLR